MQAGARLYPVPPLPGQHLTKPGEETELDLQPLYDAPYYKDSSKLEGMVALITGGESGIARSVTAGDANADLPSAHSRDRSFRRVSSRLEP
jgi:hypothetical protein